MIKSPFKYGVTVSNQAFTNRKTEFDKLYNNMVQGVNTMLISPRRWGKTSLVEKVINSLNNKEMKIKTVVIDLFAVSSEEEFLTLFAREVIKASSTKWEEWVQNGKEFFKQLVPRMSMGIEPHSDFAISFDWNDIQRHRDEILNLPEIISEKKKIRMVICLDEFQNLTNYNTYEALEKMMRAYWQRHKNVTYCLYGSKRHMMEDIFNNPSKPFYRFGDIIFMDRIKKEDWVKFITTSFRKTGKKINKKQSEWISEQMKNHSWYVQQLSHFVWMKTETKVTQEILDLALQELINGNTPLYQREIEELSITQVNLLKAVISGEIQFTSTRVMQDYDLGTPNNVRKNRITLENADIIQDTPLGYEFLDPAFEIWFRRIVKK